MQDWGWGEVLNLFKDCFMLAISQGILYCYILYRQIIAYYGDHHGCCPINSRLAGHGYHGTRANTSMSLQTLTEEK